MEAKVVLINLPSSREQYIGTDNYFPIGLLSLASILKKRGIDTRLVDINNYFYGKEFSVEALNSYIENELLRYINEFKPDIIGISCLFSGVFSNVLITADKIKSRFPQIPIVTGGIHPTAFAREILNKYRQIDYIILGEGEISFWELIASVINKKRSLEAIDGIAYRNKGIVTLNPKTNFIADLDALPFIDYSILNIEEYYNMDTSKWYSPKGLKIGQPFPIISSRSCPHKCNFCSMWLVHGVKFRPRSEGNVLDEMEHLYNDYNVRYFQFMDDNMTFDKRRALAICNGILKRGMNIQFDTPNGLAINRLNKELIDAMVDAGWISTAIAIESGSEYIRNKIIKKGLRTDKIYEVAEALAKHDHLFIKVFFIIGMPEETHESLEDTYEMIKILPIDKLGIYFAAPYPYTELYDYCLKHNLLRYKPEDYVDVKIFQDTDDYPHFKPHKLTYDDLISFKRKCCDYMIEKRKSSNLPNNYPLRYRNTASDKQ